jgi:hypothetical protein
MGGSGVEIVRERESVRDGCLEASSTRADATRLRTGAWADTSDDIREFGDGRWFRNIDGCTGGNNTSDS